MDTRKNSEIYIENPLTCLRILRNFGYILKHFYIDFRIFNVKICTKIEHYISEYCSKSLHQLTLAGNSSTILFNGLNKPLENITTIKIYLYGSQTLSHIPVLNEHLPKLQYIHIENISYVFGEKDSEIRSFENIEKFSILGGVMYKYPLSFDKLKHFAMSSPIVIDDELCTFVCNIQNLKTLKLLDIRGISENAFSKMLESPNFLSNIEELFIEVSGLIYPDCILRYLEQSKSLKRLGLVRHQRLIPERPSGVGFFNFDDLIKIISNLSAKWKFYIIDHFVDPLKGPLVKFDCHVIERV